MADGVEIEVDYEEVKKKLGNLAKSTQKVKKAINMALNETINGVLTDSKRAISNRYNIKNKYDSVNTLKREKSTISTLTAQVKTTGRPLSIPRVKFRKNGKRVSVFANPKKSSSGGRTGGFFAKAKNGHRMVLVRTGKFSHKSKGSEEQQDRAKTPKGVEGTREQFTLGASHMLKNEEVLKEVEEKAHKRLDKSLERAVNKVISDSMKK